MEIWKNCMQNRLLYDIENCTHGRQEMGTKLWGKSEDTLKKYKVCTHHTDIIDTNFTHFNDIVQLEIHKDADLDTGCILMMDLFSDFTLGIIVTDTDPQTVINNFVTNWVQRMDLD